jgi:hypothetical protein
MVRIQLKRGNKQAVLDSSLLAGEVFLAMDTQELYFGDGDGGLFSVVPNITDLEYINQIAGEDDLVLIYDHTVNSGCALKKVKVSDILAAKVPDAGSTLDRPITPNTGFMYFDTTLNRPIWFSGNLWVDALGVDPYVSPG